MTPALDTLLLPFADGDLPKPKRALFLKAETHHSLQDWPDLVGWQPFRPEAEAWERAGLTRVDEVEGKWPLVMVIPGKDRDEAFVLFAMAFDHLEAGGQIIVSMPNGAGGGRFEKELGQICGPLEKRQKHKCRVFWTEPGARPSDELLDEWRQLGVRRTVPETDFTVEAGVYGSGQVDVGSALLVEHFPKRLHGKVADLGAGWGYLSHELLKRCRGVRQIDLYEADARALDCARENVVSENVDLNFLWSDVTAGVPADYDVVVMNPPFHRGLATDVGLGKQFIEVACRALKRRGELWIVANIHLPYEAELDALGMRWRIVEQTSTFKVFMVNKGLTQIL